jgi:hypothetical protein
MEKVKFRPMGKIINIIEALGLEVNHYYDDLVFVNNSVFIVQYDDEDDCKIHIHFNKECAYEDSLKIFSAIENLSKEEGLKAVKGNIFILSQVSGKEEIQIKFLN